MRNLLFSLFKKEPATQSRLRFELRRIIQLDAPTVEKINELCAFFANDHRFFQVIKIDSESREIIRELAVDHENVSLPYDNETWHKLQKILSVEFIELENFQISPEVR